MIERRESTMKPNEVAKLTGITVRTLQYYDKIGLLKPSFTAANGYRTYNQSDLELLQQILFFRELEFSLTDIKEIIQNPNYNKQDALMHHRELLLEKRKRLDGLIALVNQTLKGGTTMSFKEFDTTKIDEAKDAYVKEVKKRWGTTDAYKEYTDKSKNRNQSEFDRIVAKGNEIINEFSKIRTLSPSCEEAQRLVQKWQAYITENYYHCTKEILSGLGQMYLADERFTKNMDQFGQGTTKFISEAIDIYCSK